MRRQRWLDLVPESLDCFFVFFFLFIALGLFFRASVTLQNDTLSATSLCVKRAYNFFFFGWLCSTVSRTSLVQQCTLRARPYVYGGTVYIYSLISSKLYAPRSCNVFTSYFLPFRLLFLGLEFLFEIKGKFAFRVRDMEL